MYYCLRCERNGLDIGMLFAHPHDDDHELTICHDCYLLSLHETGHELADHELHRVNQLKCSHNKRRVESKNGTSLKMYVCEDCDRELGYFRSFDLDLDDIETIVEALDHYSDCYYKDMEKIKIEEMDVAPYEQTDLSEHEDRIRELEYLISIFKREKSHV